MRMDEWSKNNLHIPPMLTEEIDDTVKGLPSVSVKPENSFPPITTHEHSALNQPYVKYGNILNEDGSYI